MERAKLPWPWVQLIDDSYDQYYYYNIVSGDTVWKSPGCVITSARLEPDAVDHDGNWLVEAEMDARPRHLIEPPWEVRIKNCLGCEFKYYHNNATGASSWIHPDLLRESQGWEFKKRR